MPESSPLITVAALSERLGDPALRIVDCRWYLGRPGEGRQAYDAGHIPGAIHLDVDRDLAADPEIGPGRHPLPDVADLVRRLEAAGIGDEHVVVTYDDVGGWVAARLWWMLDDLGHERVVVLDGGWPAWLAAGGAVSTDMPAFPPARLHVRDRWTRVIDLDGLRPRLGQVVTSCGSGVSACHDALAMRIAGLPDPLLYPGSYSDWSRRGLPVATGPEPGPPGPTRST